MQSNEDGDNSNSLRQEHFSMKEANEAISDIQESADHLDWSNYDKVVKFICLAMEVASCFYDAQFPQAIDKNFSDEELLSDEEPSGDGKLTTDVECPAERIYQIIIKVVDNNKANAAVEGRYFAHYLQYACVAQTKLAFCQMNCNKLDEETLNNLHYPYQLFTLLLQKYDNVFHNYVQNVSFAEQNEVSEEMVRGIEKNFLINICVSLYGFMIYCKKKQKMDPYSIYYDEFLGYLDRLVNVPSFIQANTYNPDYDTKIASLIKNKIDCGKLLLKYYLDECCKYNKSNEAEKLLAFVVKLNSLLLLLQLPNEWKTYYPYFITFISTILCRHSFFEQLPNGFKVDICHAPLVFKIDNEDIKKVYALRQALAMGSYVIDDYPVCLDRLHCLPINKIPVIFKEYNELYKRLVENEELINKRLAEIRADVKFTIESEGDCKGEYYFIGEDDKQMSLLYTAFSRSINCKYLEEKKIIIIIADLSFIYTNVMDRCLKKFKNSLARQYNQSIHLAVTSKKYDENCKTVIAKSETKTLANSNKKHKPKLNTIKTKNKKGCSLIKLSLEEYQYIIRSKFPLKHLPRAHCNSHQNVIIAEKIAANLNNLTYSKSELRKLFKKLRTAREIINKKQNNFRENAHKGILDKVFKKIKLEFNHVQKHMDTLSVFTSRNESTKLNLDNVASNLGKQYHNLISLKESNINVKNALNDNKEILNKQLNFYYKLSLMEILRLCSEKNINTNPNSLLYSQLTMGVDYYIEQLEKLTWSNSDVNATAELRTLPLAKTP